jgi:hypothetical protein
MYQLRLLFLLLLAIIVFEQGFAQQHNTTVNIPVIPPLDTGNVIIGLATQFAARRAADLLLLLGDENQNVSSTCLKHINLTVEALQRQEMWAIRSK